MYDIASYIDAHSIPEAIELLQANPKAKLIAGGSDILIKIHDGKMQAAQLIGIRNIPELQGVFMQVDKTLIIGAACSFSQLVKNKLIQENIPVLAEAVDMVGGPQIRNIGTIGGNVCNGVTSADSAATLFALNAKLKLQGTSDSRIVPIQEFYKDAGKVDIQHNEVLINIQISKQDYEKFGGHYIKYAMRNAMDIATLGCVVLCKVSGKKIIEDCRLAFGVAAPTPVRCPKTEDYVSNKQFSEQLLEEIASIVQSEINPRTSWRATREFRLQIAGELTKRAFREAFVKAGGELS